MTDLRSQVSLVSQDVVLFNDTIRNNIAFNALNTSDAELEAAARAANVMESSRNSRWDSMRRSRIGDRICRVASGRGFPSRARSSRTLRY